MNGPSFDYPTGPFPSRPRRRQGEASETIARQKTGPQGQAPGRIAAAYSAGAETHDPATVRDATGDSRQRPAPDFPEVMLPAEAAAFLRISKTTLWRAMKRGLPHVKVQGKTLFLKTALLDYLAGLSTG